MSAERAARVVLLVEDNAGDADLVREMLEAVDGHRYRVDLAHVSRVSRAVDRLGQGEEDIIGGTGMPAGSPFRDVRRIITGTPSYAFGDEQARLDDMFDV